MEKATEFHFETQILCSLFTDAHGFLVRVELETAQRVIPHHFLQVVRAEPAGGKLYQCSVIHPVRRAQEGPV